MSDKDQPPPVERTIIRPARPVPPPGAQPAAGGFAPPPPPPPPAGGGQERTVIAPQGGAMPPGFGSAAPQGAAPPPPPPPPRGGAPARLDFADAEPEMFGPEPLVAAAGRLIHLATRLRTMAVGPDLSALRQLTIAELDAFSKRAQGLGLEPRSVQLAHYILCAFLDDAVMATPWGANSPWSQHSLLAAYHNDVQGGERLFQFAERMEQDPNREPRLMELLYLCLSLGFEGRAALDPRGASLLQQRRARLAGAIARVRGGEPDELSPQWHGQAVGAGAFAPRVPLWVAVMGLALVGLVIFSALLFRLSSETTAAVTALDQAVGTRVLPPAPPAPETETPTYDRIRAILASDVDAGRLAVLREGNDIVLRLVNQGLFASGSADVSGAWGPTFVRLAEAANLTRGQLRIEGHTDNQQIRSLAFPSNLQLSQARAAAVGRALRSAGLQNGDRIRTDGYGDGQPIGDNATEDGRRENRRVEIRVANDVAWR
ncbi:MAG: type IVB secretion system protein IcmH/DotU [Sphingomonas fennica]